MERSFATEVCPGRAGIGSDKRLCRGVCERDRLAHSVVAARSSGRDGVASSGATMLAATSGVVLSRVLVLHADLLCVDG
jgi:hypothetical protein